MVRGLVNARLGDLEPAKADLGLSHEIADRIGWPIGIGQASWGLGFVALCESDFQQASALLSPLAQAIEANGVYEWPIAMSLPDGIEALVGVGELDVHWEQ